MAATILGSASIVFTGSWTNPGGGGYNGEDYYYHASGSGTNKAAFTFTGLTPGAKYAIALTWNAFSNRATNAPWTIYDSNGTSVLTSGTINQQNIAQGQTSLGVAFQWLSAPVTPTSTSLTVTWNDNANGFVTADAAWLEPVSDALNCTALTTGNWSTSGTWLPYIPCQSQAITGTAAGTAGVVRLTMASTAGFIALQPVNVLGVGGTTEANGAWTLSNVVDSTHVELTGSTWANVWTSGGTIFRGDQVTLASGVTLTVDSGACDASGLLIIGKSPNTGGTAAIQSTQLASAISANCSILIPTAGTQLRVRGDVLLTGALTTGAAGTVAMTFSAGTGMTFDVPASQQYIFGFTGLAQASFAGSNGSRCTCKASLGASASALWLLVSTHLAEGVNTASYTDFAYFGTTSAYGINFNTNETTGTQNVSWTNCTIDHCSWLAEVGTTNAQTGTWTFQNNICTNGINTTTFGGNYPYAFDFGTSSGTVGAFSGNSFDGALYIAKWFGSGTYTGNYHGSFIATITTYWSGSVTFSDNFFSVPSTSAFGLKSITNCYFYGNATNSNHLTSIISGTADSCIFEGGAVNSGFAQFIISLAASSTVTIQRCIGIRDAAGDPPAVNFLGGYANGTVSMTHCTGLDCQFGEGGVATLHMVPLYAANLMVWAAAGLSNTKVRDVNQTTTDALTPTGAKNNGSYNVSTITPFTGGPSGSGNGYNTKLSATPALDVADQDPQFVAGTRNLAAWGGTVTGGGVATAVAAMATLAANPALITQATTGLIPWIKAGFRPQNTALKAVSYAGDPLTVDAAGNAWLGAAPDIGAMAWTSGASTPVGGAALLMSM